MDAALKLFPTSASQIDTFKDCQRKWAWEKLEGLARPSSAAAERGTKVHSVLEKYLATGKLSLDDDYGKIAQAGLKYLPAPGVDPKYIEEWFEFEVDGILYRGLMDLHMPPDDETSNVLDHKSTTDFRWIKHPDVLGEDVQQVLYAFAAMSADGTSRALMRWVYYRATPKRPKAEKVEMVVEREETGEKFERLVHALALEMRDVAAAYRAEKIKVKDLPPNAQTCSKYGGCAFIKNCGLTAREMARSIYMQASMAEKMRKKLEAKKNGATEEASSEKGETEEKPAETKGARAAVSRLKNKGKGVNAPEGPEPGTPETSETAETAPSEKGKANDVEKKGDVPRTSERIAGDFATRDLIAVQAMQGLIARREHALSEPGTADTVATLSYEFADAMLKAR